MNSKDHKTGQPKVSYAPLKEKIGAEEIFDLVFKQKVENTIVAEAF